MNQAGSGDQPVIGAQHAGPQPAQAAGDMRLAMSAHAGTSQDIECLHKWRENRWFEPWAIAYSRHAIHMSKSLSGLGPVKDFRITAVLGAALLAGGAGRAAAAADAGATAPRRRGGRVGHLLDLLHRVPQHRGLGRRRRLRRHVRSRTSPTTSTCSRRRCASCAASRCRRAATRCRTRPPATPSSPGWKAASTRPAREHEDPGHVGLHRLNRKEYANAVRDLLGIDIRPGRPAAARRTARRLRQHRRGAAGHARPSSTSTSPPRAPWSCRPWATRTRCRPAPPIAPPSPARSCSTRTACRFGTRGGIAVDHNFPADGEYVLNIANMAQALWVYNMEFREPADRHARRQADLRDLDRRRRRHEGHRPEAGSGGRCHQQAPEEHPLPRHGRRAPLRRGVPSPHLRRVGRPAADVHARRRPGSRAAREFLRDHAVRSTPRASARPTARKHDLRGLLPEERGRRDCPARARSSATWRAAPSAARSPTATWTA